MSTRRPTFRPWCRKCNFRYALPPRGLCERCETKTQQEEQQRRE